MTMFSTHFRQQQFGGDDRRRPYRFGFDLNAKHDFIRVVPGVRPIHDWFNSVPRRLTGN